MEKHLIYANGSSNLTAESDGEIVQLTQELNGEIIGTISLYVDELETALKFAKSVDVEYE